MVAPEYYQDLLRRVFLGRKIIVCADALVGAAAVGKTLTDLGAARPMLLAGTRGTGDIPSEEDAARIVLNTGGKSVMAAIRAYERALRDLPADARDALDVYDPDREAIVVGTLFMRDGEMWGREVFGGRPLSWERLEDKMVIDELLDAAGIPRAPSEIVPVDAGALTAAAGRVDAGNGTAWAADAKEGWWGGAEYLRWVRTAADRDDAIAFFAKHCDRVRVMPFLDGIACSIHGMVFADEVIVFRPVEMLTLRRVGSNTLQYAGLATYWDPSDADREQMRDAARALGAHLRERVDYRDAFTLDGVMTADGFRPTELNARAGAGLGPQSAAAGVNLGMISNLIKQGRDIDFKARDLEALVVARADESRFGGCYTVFPGVHEKSERHDVVEEGEGFRPAQDGEGPDGYFMIGPSSVGGFIRYVPDFAKTPRGPSFAPTAVRAFAYSDERFGTGLGPLEAAPSVR